MALQTPTTSKTFQIVATSRKLGAIVLVCLVLLAVAGCASLPASAAGLRILLANDDGYSSPGIEALHKALVEAGHDVTVVAPEGNRSGSSSSVTAHGELELKQHGPGVWSVNGTPADALHVGLDVVLGGEAPDLVVSGANFGQNIGPATLVSGTVGVALSALQRGLPAIAVSVGIDPREMQSEPRFKSTLAAFPGCAELTVGLIAALQASQPEGEPLLPPRIALNMNYPARMPEALKGVVQAQIGQSDTFSFAWKRGEKPGQLVADFKTTSGKEPIAGADTTLFSDGYVTITTLDRDVLAPAAKRDAVGRRIAAVLSQ